MWILLRLLLGAGAFLFRLFYKPRPVDGDYLIEGVPCEQKVVSWKGKVLSVTLKVPFKTALLFKITPESGIDRLFKSLGLARELQSGDHAFDENVYIACDQPFLAEALTRNDEARGAVQRILNCGYCSIVADGQSLAIKTKSRSPEETPEHMSLLVGLKRAMAEVESVLPGRLSDRFTWRALAIEALVWSIVGYGIAGILDAGFNRDHQHLEGFMVFTTGLTLAGLLALILVPFILMLMRGSSRGHRIIVEGLIALLIGLPLAGYQAVADVNRGLDNRVAEEYTYEVVDKRERVHRRRRGGTSRSYYIQLGSSPLKQPSAPRINTSSIPQEIQVSFSLYLRADPQDRVRLLIKPGWLQFPWFEQITVE